MHAYSNDVSTDCIVLTTEKGKAQHVMHTSVTYGSNLCEKQVLLLNRSCVEEGSSRVVVVA